MPIFPSLFQHFAFMKPQNTWIRSPTLLHKGLSVRASRDTPGSSWATCSRIWQHLELNSYSLVFKGNLLHIVHPFAEHQWEESEFIFFTSAHETFMNIGENPAKLSLVKVKLSRLSQPLTLSDAPIPETSLWAFSAFAPAVSVLYWGPQKWIQNPRYDLTTAQQRGEITFFNLLSPPFTLQPWAGTWEHCLLMLNLSSRNDVCLSLSSCFPDSQPQACSGARCRIWPLRLLNILSFLSVHFSSVLRCPWIVADPSADLAPAQTIHPSSLLCADLLRGHCPITSFINEDIQLYWPLCDILWLITCVWPSDGISAVSH